MSGDAVPLDELEIAYRRVSRALYRAQEDALDFSAEEIIAALDRDQTIVDAAFFVLIFGQVESRINGLAASRLTRPEQRSAIREAKFERRLAKALPGAGWRRVREELEDWYKTRNRAAHGEEVVAGGYNISGIFERARELDALLSDP
ncbi:MAG: hypothetical protein WA417_16170 [Stellaceae bacterium]